MTIKEVSEQMGISTDTLRYYEKIGLINPVAKNTSGRRNYQEHDLERICFLKCMRLSGVSIEMLSQYLKLAKQGQETVLERKEILLKQREELLKKIAELQFSLDHLNHKIDVFDETLACMPL